MADYEFTTLWQIKAPLQAVWEEIRQPEHWPQWWPSVQSVVELEPGDENGLGGLWRYVWKGALPYRLTVDMRVTRTEPPVLLEGAASGDLHGVGRWQLSGDDTATTVRFDWRVSGPRPWMRVVAPVTRPVFRWNHNHVMEHGRLGLVKRIMSSAEMEKTP